MSVELRPPRVEDAVELAVLFKRFGDAYGAEYERHPDIETWFTNPGMDLERDARIALEDSAIVGYGDAGDAGGEGSFVYLDLRIDPDRIHDVAPVVLDFAEGRALELAREGGVLKAWTPERAAELGALYGERGFAFDHLSLRMEVELGEEPATPEWPEGISVRTFRETDTKAVYEADQEAFADEPDHVREPFDEWTHFAFRDPFDPELWFLAFDGDEVAGLSLCRPYRGEDHDRGWVQALAVRRPWRRRGLGLALLLHSLRELRAMGKPRAGLGVHAENPTGAVRLYERAGMYPVRTSLWYRRSV